MRAFLTWVLVLGMMAAPALARAGEDGHGGSAPAKSSANASGANTTASAKSNDGRAANSNAAAPANANDKTDSSAPAAPAAAAAPSTPAAPSVDDQLQQLRDLVNSQSKELAATRAQMKEQQEKMKALENQLKPASAPAANSAAAPAVSAVAAPVSSSSSLPAAPTVSEAPKSAEASSSSSSAEPHSGEPPAAAAAPATATAQVGNETSPNPETSPLQLKVGSAYITPVGFMDFTGVWRSRDGGSGIGTNFAGIPYGGSSSFQANESEFRFSMQNSRIGFRVDANVKGSHVIGYMEADFLGAAPANLAVSSNSNTLRSRLYWVDVRKGAFELLGGQTWSLATPNRVGVSPLPGDVFYSDNMDTNYQVGMVWGRIPEFRMAYHLPNDKAAFAVALDSPDQYMGGTNGSTVITLPSCCSYYQGKELDDGTGTLGPPNRGPDVIAKFVADPNKRIHFEVGGIARFFQLYNQKPPTHFSTTGGAGFVNLDLGITKELRFLTHNYWSDGGGRYIFGSAPDMIIRADGSPSLVHAGSTVDGFELTHKNTTLFAYYGAIYIVRNVAVDTTGCFIGWGFGASPKSATSCASPVSGQNRVIQEPTIGFIKNFWKDSKYGALSLIGQYSYVTRDPWVVTTGNPKNGFSSMAFLDLRYTLPGSAPTMGKPGKE
jgi:phage shock protein A